MNRKKFVIPRIFIMEGWIVSRVKASRSQEAAS